MRARNPHFTFLRRTSTSYVHPQALHMTKYPGHSTPQFFLGSSKLVLAYCVQRAARATAQQQMRDAELQWQQATIADDNHKAAMQRKELAARYDRSLQHAQELELQIEQRDQTRQQMHAARAQARFRIRQR